MAPNTTTRTPQPAASAGAHGVASNTPERKRHTSFRPEIEGLRAVAVMLVVLFHAGLPYVDGGFVGVDVFFVISGFLITGILANEARSTGTVVLRDFYLRRTRRLLPALTVVIVTTLVLTAIVSSPLIARATAVDAVWSSVYLANFHFLAVGVDYFAIDSPDSPLLHLWSLAVEEQFYLVWPLVIVVAARRSRTRRGRNFFIALTAIAVASLVASVVITMQWPLHAYFLPFTRAYELAIGGLVALGMHRIPSVPRRVGVAAAWIGLAAIVYSGVTFSETMAFPGAVALVPVLGTALVIAFAVSGAGVGRVLSTKPMMGIGRWSYSLYLWHWPLLVLFANAGFGETNIVRGLICVAVSIVLAWLTFHVIENPIRRSPWLAARRIRGLILTVAMTAIPIACAVVVWWWAGESTGNGAPVAAPNIEKAAAPADALQQELARSIDTRELPANVRPPIHKVRSDTTAIFTDGCHQRTAVNSAHSPECTYGASSNDAPIVLFGDSHAAHWFPTLDAVATSMDRPLISLTRGACPSIDVVPFTAEKVCAEWRTLNLERIAREQPYMVVISNQNNYCTRADCSQGIASTVGAIRSSSPTTTVVILEDVPTARVNVPICVSEHTNNIRACITSRATADKQLPRGMREAAADAGAGWVETTDWFCTPTACPPLVGNIVVYMDTGHLTLPMADLLVPVVEEALRASQRSATVR